MKDKFEVAMGVICLVALCAWIWAFASAEAELGVIETCDNYGSFVYKDARYTCERVMK